MWRNLFTSPFSTLIWRSWVRTPWPAKNVKLKIQLLPRLMLNFLSHFLPIQLAWCYLDPSFLLFLLIWNSVFLLTLWMFQSLSQTGSNILVTRFLMKTLPSPNLVPPTSLMSFSGTDFPVSQRKSCYQNTSLVTLRSKNSKGRSYKCGTDLTGI